MPGCHRGRRCNWRETHLTLSAAHNCAQHRELIRRKLPEALAQAREGARAALTDQGEGSEVGGEPFGGRESDGDVPEIEVTLRLSAADETADDETAADGSCRGRDSARLSAEAAPDSSRLSSRRDSLTPQARAKI